MRNRIRSTFSATSLLVRRRARRDGGLLVAWIVLVGFATVLAVGGPRLITATTDDGARDAVAAAGSRGDVVVQTGVGRFRNGMPEALVPPAEVEQLAADLHDRLPATTRASYRDATVSVLSAQLNLPATIVTPRASANLSMRIGMLSSDQVDALTVVDGALPTDDLDPSRIPVVVSAAVADAAGLAVGSTIPLTPNVLLSVVGIVDRSGSGALWRGYERAFTPAPAAGKDPRVGLTVLALPSGADAASSVLDDSFTATFRMRPVTSTFTAASLERVADETRALAINHAALVAGSGYDFRIDAGLSNAVADFAAQKRAALAQLTMLLAGVLAVAAAVIVLVARLLVIRRSADVRLERARGASLASVATRALLESVLAGGVGVIIGLGATAFSAPGSFFVVLVVVAVLAGPAMTVSAAVRGGPSRRSPANRADRAAIEGRRRVRRIAIEVTVVLLAVAGVVALRSRGLLQSESLGVDPLLAVTPLLFGVVIAIVVLRVYPPVVRATAAVAGRTRGVHGLVGAVRARNAIAVLPVLALTLAIALVASNQVLTETVRAGQVEASWQRIGADVRIESPLDATQLDRLRSAPGVAAAASFAVIPDTTVALGTSSGFVTLLAVDSHYPDVVAALPRVAGTPDDESARTLRMLQPASSSSERLPMVADSTIGARIVSDEPVLTIGQQNIRATLVGQADKGPTGYLEHQFAYVDIDALSAYLSDPAAQTLGTEAESTVTPTTTLVVGSGAEAAVAALALPSSVVHARSDWLQDRRDLALVAGVQAGTTLSAAVLAVLALVALLATIVAGSRERARSLALFRTLGASRRFGWWLAISDLGPPLAAAVVGGIGAGLAMALLLGPSLGLDALTGGPLIPLTVVPVLRIVAVAVGVVVLLGIAVGIELLAERRDRLGDVLRVGETI